MGKSSRKILTLVEQSDNRNLFLRYWARNPIVWVLSACAVKAVTTRLTSTEILELVGPDAAQHAAIAAKTIVGGLFDIAEIYDASGNKLRGDGTVDDRGQTLTDEQEQALIRQGFDSKVQP